MLADYTKLVLFRTEHPEAYWKLFEMWLEWWRLDGLYGRDYESYHTDKDLRDHEYDHREALFGQARGSDWLFSLWMKGIV